MYLYDICIHAKIHYIHRAAVATIMASVGGGVTSIVYTYVKERGRFDVGYIVNGILGALVAITGKLKVD